MLKIDLKKIKQDAEKVDPQWYEVCRKESWVIKRWHECGGETDLFEAPDSRFAKHIENTNPENTLALVAEIERLQGLLEKQCKLVDSGIEMAKLYAYRRQVRVQGEFTGDIDVDAGPLYHHHYEDIDPGVEPALEWLKDVEENKNG